MTADHNLRIGAILLAAGGSSRLGQPKQLLEFKGLTLIRRAAEMLGDSVCSPVVAVIGAELDRSSAELEDIDISIIVNEQWGEGMSTSIRSGLNNILLIEPELDAVVITLCDQPFVQTEEINRLAAKFTSSGKPIVASRYADVIGVPALFAREMFKELCMLEGDEGARKLIRSHVELTSTVDLKSAAIDIDAPEDIINIS